MQKSQVLPALIRLLIIGGWAATAEAQITVDGALSGSEGYGAALATQTINTGFGDNTSSGGTSSGGSELDAIYSLANNGYLYLFIAGNLEANGNNRSEERRVRKEVTPGW